MNANPNPPSTPNTRPANRNTPGAPSRPTNRPPGPSNNNKRSASRSLFGNNGNRNNGNPNNGNPNQQGGKKRRVTKLTGKMVRAVGSRVQVWNGTAHHTSGGLQKKDLMMSHGRIVSKSRHELGKKNKTFKKLTALTKRGKFKLITKAEAKKALAK